MTPDKLTDHAGATTGPTRSRLARLGLITLAGVASSTSALALFFYVSGRTLDVVRAPPMAVHAPRARLRAPSAPEPALLTNRDRSAEPPVRARPPPPDTPPAIASAKAVRDPAVDRAQRGRLVALGEERLRALQKEAESSPEGERRVLRFRTERMQRQLAELRAKP
jgi:hypothetical protein